MNQETNLNTFLGLSEASVDKVATVKGVTYKKVKVLQDVKNTCLTKDMIVLVREQGSEFFVWQSEDRDKNDLLAVFDMKGSLSPFFALLKQQFDWKYVKLDYRSWTKQFQDLKRKEEQKEGVNGQVNFQNLSVQLENQKYDYLERPNTFRLSKNEAGEKRQRESDHKETMNVDDALKKRKISSQNRHLSCLKDMVYVPRVMLKKVLDANELPQEELTEVMYLQLSEQQRYNIFAALPEENKKDLFHKLYRVDWNTSGDIKWSSYYYRFERLPYKQKLPFWSKMQGECPQAFREFITPSQIIQAMTVNIVKRM